MGYSMQARAVTESSYIMITDIGERFGILLKDDKVSLITKEAKHEFDTIADLEEVLGEKISFVKKEQHKEASNIDIDGYPVKHDEVFDVEKGKLISYKSTPNSRVRWIAGWWGIKFTRGYICFLCPKNATLTENEYVGPFKTQFDAEHAVKLKNKELRDQEK